MSEAMNLLETFELHGVMVLLRIAEMREAKAMPTLSELLLEAQTLPERSRPSHNFYGHLMLHGFTVIQALATATDREPMPMIALNNSSERTDFEEIRDASRELLGLVGPISYAYPARFFNADLDFEDAISSVLNGSWREGSELLLCQGFEKEVKIISNLIEGPAWARLLRKVGTFNPVTCTKIARMLNVEINKSTSEIAGLSELRSFTPKSENESAADNIIYRIFESAMLREVPDNLTQADLQRLKALTQREIAKIIISEWEKIVLTETSVSSLPGILQRFQSWSKAEAPTKEEILYRNEAYQESFIVDTKSTCNIPYSDYDHPLWKRAESQAKNVARRESDSARITDISIGVETLIAAEHDRSLWIAQAKKDGLNDTQAELFYQEQASGRGVFSWAHLQELREKYGHHKDSSYRGY